MYQKTLEVLNTQKTKQEAALTKLKKDVSKAQQDINKLDADTQKNNFTIDQTSTDKKRILEQDFETRIKELIKQLDEHEKERKVRQTELENLQEQWKTKLALFADAAEAQQRQDENQEHLNKIQGLIKDIDAKMRVITQLKLEGDALRVQITTDLNRDSLQSGYVEQLRSIEERLARLQEEKKASFDELNAAVKELIAKNKYIKEQEDEIKRLRAELEGVGKDIAAE